MVDTREWKVHLAPPRWEYWRDPMYDPYCYFIRVGDGGPQAFMYPEIEREARRLHPLACPASHSEEHERQMEAALLRLAGVR